MAVSDRDDDNDVDNNDCSNLTAGDAIVGGDLAFDSISFSPARLINIIFIDIRKRCAAKSH